MILLQYYTAGFEGLSLTLSAQDVTTWWRIVDNRATRISESGKFEPVSWELNDQKSLGV